MKNAQCNAPITLVCEKTAIRAGGRLDLQTLLSFGTKRTCGFTKAIYSQCQNHQLAICLENFQQNYMVTRRIEAMSPQYAGRKQHGSQWPKQTRLFSEYAFTWSVNWLWPLGDQMGVLDQFNSTIDRLHFQMISIHYNFTFCYQQINKNIVIV